MRFILYINFILFIPFCEKVVGQSKIQEVGVRAPDNVKIDGRTLEWRDDKMQAYNSANDVAYTVSNDDANLYLTVRAPYYIGPAKILYGGLTFMVSHGLERKDREKANNNVAVTFPILTDQVAQDLVMSLISYRGMNKDSSRRVSQHDSLVRVIDKKALKAFTEFRITGIPSLDTLQSIYNETGVKAMATFSRAMTLCIEMAIPLKYLGLSVNDGTKFSYNIKLNGRFFDFASYRSQNTSGIGNSNPTAPQAPQISPDFEFMNSPSDFWGTCVLIKK